MIPDSSIGARVAARHVKRDSEFACVHPKKKRGEELEQVVQMLRDDAFSEASGQLKPYNMRPFEAKLAENHTIKIHPSIESICREVAEKKSQHAAVLLKELYLIFESVPYTSKYSQIADFAKRLIDELPDKIEMDSEPDPAILEMAKALIESLNLPLDPLQIATDMKKKMDQMNEEMSDQEEGLIKNLGLLLLVAQNNIKGALEAIQSDSTEEILEHLNTISSEIYEKAKEKIAHHVATHSNTALQNSNEALMHKLSIELAELLVLESGAINFGIIESLVEEVIPDSIQNTNACNGIMQVLSSLMMDPDSSFLLAHANVPKNLKSAGCTAIRTTLGLDPKEIITKRHVQITIVSALLGHFRQSYTGTCFTTCFLIKAFHEHLSYVITDLMEMLEDSKLTRIIIREEKSFPMCERISIEYLHTKLHIDSNGVIVDSENPRLSPDQQHLWKKPSKNALIWEAPGIIAACRQMGIKNMEEEVKLALLSLTNPIMPEELIKQLAKQAFDAQERTVYSLRSSEHLTLDQYEQRGLYAYGAETNHPLHRAYEQTTATMVSYFSSQYQMGSWIHLTIQEVLDKNNKGYPRPFQALYNKLLKETFLPLITRAHFIYNHNLDDYTPLFDPKQPPVQEHSHYGYELWDSGLPEDFEYSDQLIDQIKKETSHITLERFKDYPPVEKWVKMESEDKFRTFILDVAKQTAAHLIKNDPANKGLIERVCQKMCEDINQPSFTKKVIFLIFGRDSKQKRNYLKNEASLMTTPWKYRWGGDFNAIMKSFFGLDRAPVKTKKFSGNPKEVLAKCIRFVKDQPDEIKDGLHLPHHKFPIASPIHAFLLTPYTPSFQEAWRSELEPAEYIQKHVIEPGLAICQKRLPRSIRSQLIDLIQNNSWISQIALKHDLDRQQLTETSQSSFDLLIGENEEISDLSVKEFCKELAKLVDIARSCDPKIGKRNGVWKKKCEQILLAKAKQLVGSDNFESKIPEDVVDQLTSFARNRKDDAKLENEAKLKFALLANNIRSDLMMPEFVKSLVEAAYKVYKEQFGAEDKAWKKELEEAVCSKLFALLPEETKSALISSGIVTHDFNWKSGIYDRLAIFLVNPGSGKLEICDYIPDRGQVSFFSQEKWFKEGWEFPENYLFYENGPAFDIKHLLGV